MSAGLLWTGDVVLKANTPVSNRAVERQQQRMVQGDSSEYQQEGGERR
jgi:hypothetical protein